MNINTIRKRLFGIVNDIQREKIEIMKLVGRENMTIIKTNSIIPQTPLDLKMLNKHLIEKQKSII
jgi:hypothetical protein|nr:MAG TPA: hypothetical protein [Bacteriophage sp.]